ncbi:MAG: hypothetical protein ACRC6O_05645 [Flavobacterium sp.]
MKKLFITVALLLTEIIFAQAQVTDTVTVVEEPIKGTWDLNLDLASRYIWRGQSWGGDYPVTQLYGAYNITDRLSVGFWGTHNYKKEYFDAEGTTKGYREIDLIVNYTVSDFLTISAQQYYWPSTDRQEGVSNKLFDWGNTSSNTLDLMLMFDFSEHDLPLWFTTSTFLAGNDYRYKDEFDSKGKQNFTTYMEVGYNYEAPFGINLAPVVGVVLNNKAQYYNAGDYDKPSFVNLGCKVTKEIKLSESVVMPIWLNYTYNATDARENLGFLNHQFLVAGVTFSLSK